MTALSAPSSAMRLLRLLAFLLLAAPAWAQMPSATMCGAIQNGGSGPFDYRNERQLLSVVETHHFTPKVEALISGQSRYEVGGDLDFVLRAYPNHPKALLTAMRWAEKNKTLSPVDMPHPVECYFERALRFRPDDNVVRMLYAIFLTRNQRNAEAVRQLDEVSARGVDNAFTLYNAGMQYFDLKEYRKAQARAQEALAMGFPAVELRDRLKSVGQWSDAPAAPASPATAASSVPAS